MAGLKPGHLRFAIAHLRFAIVEATQIRQKLIAKAGINLNWVSGNGTWQMGNRKWKKETTCVPGSIRLIFCGGW